MLASYSESWEACCCTEKSDKKLTVVHLDMQPSFGSEVFWSLLTNWQDQLEARMPCSLSGIT